MRIFYSDRYVLPLPEGHRFPVAKYRMLRERVEALLSGGRHVLAEPDAARDDELGVAHAPDYVRRVQDGELSAAEIRRIGFPWSAQMVERSRRSAGATIAACRAALAEGCAINLAGGTHHAFRDRGEGYCVFNDAAVAARLMRAEGRAGRAIVIDCDVHQGNGTAAIAAGDDALFTFSIHGANNFPFRKEASDLDVELPDATGDAAYLDALVRGLHESLEHARPQLAIYLAGADPYWDDRLGRLALSKAGLLERDRLVLDACRARSLPVAVAMAGGYGHDIRDTVEVHFRTVCLAAESF